MADTPPTLATIAAAAGVSRMTVSRALRNAPDVSSKCRERVRAVAEKLGYRPDPKLTAFMHYLRDRRGGDRVETLAYVFCHRGAGEPRRSASQERFLQGVLARTGRLGYGLDRFVLAPKILGPARLAGILSARGIRGLIIASASSFDGSLDPLLRQTACCVAGAARPELVVHRATSNHYTSFRIALNHLRAKGHRRVALYIDQGTDAHLLHAWRAALADFLLAESLSPADLTRVVPAWDKTGFLAWMREQEPTVVLTHHQPAWDWLRGARLQRRVGLALLDRPPAAVDLAGIDQNHESIGSAAVDLVAARLLNHDVGPAEHPHIVTVNGTWAEGPSVRDL
jgi:LacI family transcriptional regulator